MSAFDEILKELEMIQETILGTAGSGSSQPDVDGSLLASTEDVPDHDGDQRGRMGALGVPINAFSSTLILWSDFEKAMATPREEQRSKGFDGTDVHKRTLAFFAARRHEFAALAKAVSALDYQVGIDGKEIRMCAIHLTGGDPAPLNTFRTICVFIHSSGREVSLSQMVFSPDGMKWLTEPKKLEVVKPLRFVKVKDGNPSTYAPDFFIYVLGSNHMQHYEEVSVTFPNHHIVWHPLNDDAYVRLIHYRAYRADEPVEMKLTRGKEHVATVSVPAVIYEALGSFLTWAFRQIAAARSSRVGLAPVDVLLDAAQEAGSSRDAMFGLVFAMAERYASANLTEGVDFITMWQTNRASDTLYADAANEFVLYSIRTMTTGLATAIMARDYAKGVIPVQPLFVGHVKRGPFLNVNLTDGEKPSIRSLLQQRGDTTGFWEIPKHIDGRPTYYFSPTNNSELYVKSKEGDTLKKLRAEFDAVSKEAASAAGKREVLRRQLEALEAQVRAQKAAKDDETKKTSPKVERSLQDDPDWLSFQKWKEFNERNKLKIERRPDNHDDDGEPPNRGRPRRFNVNSKRVAQIQRARDRK